MLYKSVYAYCKYKTCFIDLNVKCVFVGVP